MLKTGLRTLRNLPKLAIAQRVYKQKFEEYQRTGVPPVDVERTLLLANWATGGTYPKELSRQNVVSLESSKLTGFSDEILAGQDSKLAVKGIREEGYYLVPKIIDPDFVSELSAYLSAGPADPRDFSGPAPTDKHPDERATTWWMAQDVLLQSPAFRRLLSERFPGAVAAEYFGGAPMVMSVAMWKSYPSDVGQSASAQQFHYDGDRPLFLKMFLYLEDVTPTNGPHVYVPRTHEKKPKRFMHGARLSDKEISNEYDEDSWVQICGPKGTVFFADTQGFHKGMNVISGSRSMLQINFAADRFGPVYPTIGKAADAPADIRKLVRDNPRYFTELYDPD